MTIIVMGHIHLGTGEAARLQAELSAQVAATNAEEGCEHYSFAGHIDDPDLLIVSERWASAEALAAHGQSAHMKAFNAVLRSAELRGVSVKAWNSEFWRTLIGD